MTNTELLEPTTSAVPRVSFDDLYRRSTQYRIWSFTKEELAQVRQQVNDRGRRATAEKIAQNQEVDPSLVETVSVEEELELIAFHMRNSLTKVATFFNMPSQVKATAISFFRKFYLVHSVMEYHPKPVLLTCLFLAAKSENYFISINTFCKKLDQAPESILSLEFTILESLKFTLLHHHPFRPLYGFFFDMQDILGGLLDQKIVGKMYDDAKKLVTDALMSDAVYHFTPPQIALACFKEINNEWTMKYLEKKFNYMINEEPEIEDTEEKADDEDKKPEELMVRTDYDMLLQMINECQVVIKTAKNPSKDTATSIDRKVYYCLSPSLVLKRKRENPGDSEKDASKRARMEDTETPV